jgi:hypothetical protein
VQSIETLLQDKNKLTQLSSDLVDLTAPLHSENASAETAKIIIRFLDAKNVIA